MDEEELFDEEIEEEQEPEPEAIPVTLVEGPKLPARHYKFDDRVAREWLANAASRKDSEFRDIVFAVEGEYKPNQQHKIIMMFIHSIRPGMNAYVPADVATYPSFSLLDEQEDLVEGYVWFVRNF